MKLAVPFAIAASLALASVHEGKTSISIFLYQALHAVFWSIAARGLRSRSSDDRRGPNPCCENAPDPRRTRHQARSQRHGASATHVEEMQQAGARRVGRCVTESLPRQRRNDRRCAVLQLALAVIQPCRTKACAAMVLRRCGRVCGGCCERHSCAENCVYCIHVDHGPAYRRDRRHRPWTTPARS